MIEIISQDESTDFHIIAYRGIANLGVMPVLEYLSTECCADARVM
jgi:hypothetical protein